MDCVITSLARGIIIISIFIVITAGTSLIKPISTCPNCLKPGQNRYLLHRSEVKSILFYSSPLDLLSEILKQASVKIFRVILATYKIAFKLKETWK